MDPRDDPTDPNRLDDGTPGQGPSRTTRPTSGKAKKASGVERNSSLLAEMVAEFAKPKPKPTPAPVSDAGKFDMALVNSDEDPTLDSRRFDERDFQSHRKEDFPNTHMPLRPILSRSMKKKLSSSSGGKDGAERGAADKHAKRSLDDAGGPMFEKMPLLQQRQSKAPNPKIVTPTKEFEDLLDNPMKKVQFEVGGSPYNAASEDDIAEPKTNKPRAPKYEDPQKRLRPGSEVGGSNVPLMLKGVDFSDEEDIDEDELTSHRFADTKGYRRHHFSPRDVGQPEDPEIPARMGKFDHKPHEVFVELDILSGVGEHREWKEAARWIKYEEDVEEGADRWGNPHVASLSFHSLINLTGLLESGVVLLDLEERDLPGVAYRVVDQMGRADLILAEEKATVMRSLLLKHKHVQEHGKGGWNFGLKRNPGSLTSLQNMSDERIRMNGTRDQSPRLLQRRSNSGTRLIHQSSVPARMSSRENPSDSSITSSHQHITLDMSTLSSVLSKVSPVYMSAENLKWISNKETNIMRQIPTDAEASIVLVGKDETLQGPTMAFVRLAESAYMPNITEVPIPVRFIFILLGPSSYDLDYKEIGRSISTLMSNRHFHEIAYEAFDRKQLLKGIHEFLDESIVLPPGDWDKELFPIQELQERNKAILRRKQGLTVAGQGGDFPDGGPSDDVPDPHDPFKRSKRLFGGLVNDVKRRYPLYCSDIKDGLNVQCLATIIFIYFACVAGAIAFGGLMSKKTQDYIGITEVLIGTSIGGCAFALFSGQPLLIVGTTGPGLVFDESLFKFCFGNGMTGPEILAVRVWIGIWVAVIGLIVVCFEGSVVVRFFTRFTLEIFATLISLVFIMESMKNLIAIYREHPLIQTYGCDTHNIKPRANVALLSTILMFGTFMIAYALREFKNSTYLTPTVRKILGNFAVLIAIVVMVGVDELIVHPATTKLDIPDALEHGLSNTKPEDRGWFVRPLSLPLFWIGASILPALLLYIVIFMECSIAELIVGKKEMHLRKGSGFHLDVLILCFINTGMGFLGSCWISAATVRCVAHTVALTVYSTNNPPGEKPIVIGVKEQRVTALSVSIIMGFSVLMSSILKLIPIAVLFGVFLFMGVSSMAGIQLLERLLLLLKQVRNHPQVPYVRRVRTWKMHIYTMIQVICLCILWAIKESPAALSLPLVIILLIPFRRFILPHWFKSTELTALDGDGSEAKEMPRAIRAPLIHPVDSEEKKMNGNGIHAFQEVAVNGDINGVEDANGRKHGFRSI